MIVNLYDGDCALTKTKIKTMPKKQWGVHVNHCCAKHGCKYGDTNCPVVLYQVKQKFPCEECEHDDNMPIFLHDCDNCKFLGRFNTTFGNERYDLYACEQPYDEPTMFVARYGNDENEYMASSHNVYTESEHPLKEARKRYESTKGCR